MNNEMIYPLFYLLQTQDMRKNTELIIDEVKKDSEVSGLAGVNAKLDKLSADVSKLNESVEVFVKQLRESQKKGAQLTG